jgi:hypothetical protein
MRRWMHTCYSLVTSEESQTLILKSLSALGLLHFLALQRCFSAEQMSKRPLKEVEGMYLYTPQTIQPLPAKSAKHVLIERAGRHDRMRRSSVTVENQKSALSDRTRLSGMTGRVRSCKNLSVLWPNAQPRPIIDDQMHQVSWGPYWNMTGRVRSLHSRVRLYFYPLKLMSDWSPRPVLAGTASGQPVNDAVTVSTDRTRQVMSETASDQG